MNAHRQPLIKKLMLSIIASSTGYVIWNFYASSQITTLELDVPTYLYNQTAGCYQGPEKLRIGLQGSRRNLATFDRKNLGVFLDCRNCTQGDNYISVGIENLFLPEGLKLLHYSPLPLCISLNCQ